MFFPYLADVVMYRWPIANWVIIALNLLVFILTGFGLSDDSPLWLSRHDFHVPQLLTSAFAHIGFVHLIGNMLFLFVFGNAVNAKLGHWQYCLAYLGAALVAGLGWLALGSGLKCCGASGAIMGVVGLFAAYYPRNDVRVAYILFFKNGPPATSIFPSWLKSPTAAPSHQNWSVSWIFLNVCRV